MTREEAIYWLGRSNGLLLRIKSKCRQGSGLEVIPISDQDREDIDETVRTVLRLMGYQGEGEDEERATQ